MTKVGFASIEKSLVAHGIEEYYSENTRDAYQRDLQRFLKWGGSIPASPETIMAYIRAHQSTHRVSTLKRWLASIRLAHRLNGDGQLPTESESVRHTLKEAQAAHFGIKRGAAPLNQIHVTAMVDALDDRLPGLRDKALLLAGYYGALRRSELSRLTVSDVVFEENEMKLHIIGPQTGKETGSAVIAIRRNRHNSKYCSVEAMKRWLQSAEITQGPIFRAINQHGSIAEQSLTPHSIALIVKKAANAAGLDPSLFSGHSMRSGYIATALASGTHYARIKAMTRHKSDSALIDYFKKE